MSGALLSMQCKPAFARHETFHLRFGWLRKGFEAVLVDPEIFSDPMATVKLGVGKNMVNAIRYWCEAYNIIERVDTEARSRVPHYVPTDFGKALLGESGWDPWLEDSASLWLLHWNLLRAQSIAPVWWVAFNLFALEQFEEHQLTNLVAELSEAAGWRAVKESSIKKDVDCLVRSFAIRRTGRQTMDDVLDCPTRQLGLIAPAVGESKSWRFVTGPKSSLPAEIVLYACLDYVATNGVGQSTISLARLAGDPGAPGRAFRLSEADLWDLLQLASDARADVTTAEPSGIRQLVVAGDPVEMRDALISEYFAPKVVQAV